jgi:hypothetical protein
LSYDSETEGPDRAIFKMSCDSETEGPDRDIFKGCLMILKQRAQIGLYSGIDFNGN